MVLIFMVQSPGQRAAGSLFMGDCLGRVRMNMAAVEKSRKPIWFPAYFYFPCHTGSSLIFFFLSKVVALSMLMA